MPEENKIRDAADAIKGIVQAVPVYQDIAQLAAKEFGTALQTVAKTVHIALAPISGLVWGYDKIKDFVAASVSKRLEKTPPEQIQTPLPQIAGPALESLRYTGHDENLREMFAKLISTSMDSNTAAQAHPSFVEIIKQLSSDEAKICQLFKKDTDHPIANIRLEVEGGFRHGVRHFSILGYAASCSIPTMIQRYLDNLKRLGLVEMDFNKVLSDKNPYLELESHPDFKRLLKESKELGGKPNIERGIISSTVFGEQFFDACID